MRWKRFRDLGFRLSIPYNHSDDYLDRMEDILEVTGEIYLPVPPQYSGSGRAWPAGCDPRKYARTTKALIRSLKYSSVDLNFVMNVPVPLCKHHGILKVIGSYLELTSKVQFTVADFILAQNIRTAFPRARLCVSTLAKVQTAVAAKYWIEGAGVESITICRDINKRPDAIRSIHDLGAKIKMVVEDQCIPNCPVLLSHLQWLSLPELYEIPRESDINCLWAGQTNCSAFSRRMRGEDVWWLAQKDVVPAFLPHYQGIVDVIKLQGRNTETGQLKRNIVKYLEMETYEQPLSDFVETEESWERITSCNRNCVKCNWCKRNIQRTRPVSSSDRLAEVPSH
jgi:hypothetical protein